MLPASGHSCSALDVVLLGPWTKISSRGGSRLTARSATITRPTISVTGEIAHIIPTHERPAVAQRLVDSINHFYPGSRVYVCDDSHVPETYDGAEDVPATAYDIGLSAKRNLLVQASTEPFVMLWDDDYVCTSNTDLRVFYELLHHVDGCGMVGAEWSLGQTQDRNVWFTGQLIPNGAEVKVRPPEGEPEHVEASCGTVSYHEVDLLPNFFMARRDLLETVPWDEQLKLNEHLEFFARLTAVRADSPRGKRWRERWKKLQEGEELFKASQNGKAVVQAQASFSNDDKLDHIGGHVATGDWMEVDSGYAEELVDSGLALPMTAVKDTRPFPLPEGTEDVDMKCVLTPNVTSRHMRSEGRASEAYTEKRYRREQFMPLQKAKLGIRTRDLVQWSRYPYPSPNFEDPDSSLLELPNT